MNNKKDISLKIRFILLTGIVLAVVFYLKEILGLGSKVLGVLTPVFIGLFLAMVLNIPTQFFYKKVYKLKGKWEKAAFPLSLATSYLLLLGVIVLIIYAIIPPLVSSINTLKDALPGYVETAGNWIYRTLESAGVSTATIDTWKEQLLGQGNTFLETIADKLPAVLSALWNTTSGVINVLFALVFSLYMIADQKDMKALFRKLTLKVWKPRRSAYILRATQMFADTFTKFISGQVIISLIIGILVFIGMLIFKMPYAPLVSVVVAVTNIIPILGPYIGGAFGGILIALVDFPLAIVFIVYIVVLQLLESNFIYPKVIGDTLEISEFWVLAAVVVGNGLFGFWGILLGVPVVAVAYRLLEEFANSKRNDAPVTPDTKDTGDEAVQQAQANVDEAKPNAENVNAENAGVVSTETSDDAPDGKAENIDK